ncbi:MAG: 4-(cytidine 5'-diphospho)-2-C-methyl-D-erythritol kinase [Phycisphaeraceae bacterium]
MIQALPSASEGSTLRLACPAKVNLALSVGARDDRGYHPVATWMVAVSLADTLTLTRTGEPSSLSVAFAEDALGTHHVDWPVEKDLSWRALEALEAHAGRTLGVEMVLSKRVPAGGGLGGGSSDAAGVLVGVNRLFGLGLPDGVLKSIAAGLGADVAFFVGAHSGETSAIGTGYGEQLSAAPHREVVWLVLIWPGFGCATAGVYKAFDDQPGPHEVDLDRVLTLAAGGLVCAHDPFNDLAAPACAAEPRLGNLRKKLADELETPVHITGSGSTLFLVASDEADANGLSKRVSERFGVASVPCSSIKRG